jgi:hypothetical protein
LGEGEPLPVKEKRWWNCHWHELARITCLKWSNLQAWSSSLMSFSVPYITWTSFNYSNIQVFLSHLNFSSLFSSFLFCSSFLAISLSYTFPLPLCMLLHLRPHITSTHHQLYTLFAFCTISLSFAFLFVRLTFCFF